MEEYRIDLKVRNNLILDRIEKMGYQSVYSFCKIADISYPSLLKYVNMKWSIYDSQGRLKNSVKRICKVLNCIPEEIFSASQMEASLKTNKRTLKVNEAEAIFLLTQSDNQKLLEDHYADDQMSNAIEKSISTLTPREQKVINMRMGLGEYTYEHTFDEVGKEFNLSRERVRQVEAKALRKMRHPSRSDELRIFIDNED